MSLLIAGIALWIAAHLFPSVAAGIRQKMIERIGPGSYRGIFSLVIVVALVCIVLGWRSTPERYLYILPPWSRLVGFVGVALAFVILGAAHYETAIKRVIRHPMLTGVAVWAASHLLMNGTTRALVLFGGLGLWAMIEMPLLNRREGPRNLPEAPAFAGELKGLMISAIIFGAFLFLHPYLAGVSPLP